MKRPTRILSVSLLVSAAALAVCVGALARQTQKSDAKAAQAEAASLKSDASLAETLSWLNDNLTRYGRFTLYQPLYQPGYRDRTSFLGLEAEGCSVTYRVRHELLSGGNGSGVIQSPNNDVVRAPNGDFVRAPSNWKPAEPVGSNVSEHTVDLAALDPTLVVGKTPKKWDGGAVSFSGGRGKAAVSHRDSKGRLMQFDGGEFYVSERERVGPIEEALRRAVALCRK
jgi:hypothetical protein